MRNGLVQLGAWAAATGAAVALSWFGVHAVLTGAAFEQPTALPLPSPAAAGTARATPTVTQPQSAAQPEPPAPSATPAAAAPSRTTAPVAPATPSAAAPTSHRPTPAATTSAVRSYLVPGGKVALDLQPDKASLVSAAPDPGWKMQVWNGPQWMRVDFTKDDQANSVFVYWNGHPPVVETVTR